MSARAEATAPAPGLGFDRLGALVAILAAVAIGLGPFAAHRPNRILDGDPRSLLEAVPATTAGVTLGVLAAVALVALLRTAAAVRLAAGVAALLALAFALGAAPGHLTPPGDIYVRIAPGWGFWLAAFAFALLLADALTKLRCGPFTRLGVLAAACVVVAALFASGLFDGLSILKEYASRAETFWAEARTHVLLALGSVAGALALGVPLGLLCHRTPALRASVLNVLNVVQTVPSIALFGLLIAPLAWIAAHVPGASAVGIAGVGAAPAFVALVLYALLPVVSSVVGGLAATPAAAIDAARGAGMTEGQVLRQVEIPLALPAFLAGLRIVLVQNIGLATIAALIGGGGFGVFVFQGVGQTAIDLVLLGAAPTVALAFAAAVVLDAAIELSDRRRR